MNPTLAHLLKRYHATLFQPVIMLYVRITRQHKWYIYHTTPLFHCWKPTSNASECQYGSHIYVKWCILGLTIANSFRQEISATNLLTMATGNFCFGSKSTFTFWNHLKWNSWQPKIRTQQCLYKHWNAFLMCNKIYIRCIRGNNVFTFRVHCHTKHSKFVCTCRHMLLIDVTARGSIRSVDNVYHRFILNCCGR